MGFGQFRRAILERRARALRREQPRSSCPTVWRISYVNPLGASARRRATRSRRRRPSRGRFRSRRRCTRSPIRAWRTPPPSRRDCTDCTDLVIPSTRARCPWRRDLRRVPRAPHIPEAIPVCRGNTNPRARGGARDSHESPAVAPFARVDPSPGLAVTRPESGRSSEAHDPDATGERGRRRGSRTAAAGSRLATRALRDERCAALGTNTTARPRRERNAACRSRSALRARTVANARRAPPNREPAPFSFRATRYVRTRFGRKLRGFRRSPKTRGERRLSRSCPSATSAALRSTVHDGVWTRARATRYVRTRFGRKLRGFRARRRRGERRLSRSCPSATSAALRSTVHDCVWTRARATRYVRTRFGRKLRGFRRSPKTRGERRLSRSCPSATSRGL